MRERARGKTTKVPDSSEGLRQFTGTAPAARMVADATPNLAANSPTDRREKSRRFI